MGAAGTVAGVMAVVEPEAALLPMALVALTLKVYDVPAVRPLVIVQFVADSTRRRCSYRRPGSR